MRTIFKFNGYAIMSVLLEKYKNEPYGNTKAALAYGIGTGLGFVAGKRMMLELRESAS